MTISPISPRGISHFGLAVVEIDDLAVHVGERHPDGAGLVDAVERVAVRGGRRFRKSEALENLAAAQSFESLLGLAQERSGPGDAGFDGRKVVLAGFHVRAVVDGVIERRYAGEDGGMEFVDVLQHVGDVARVGDHHHAGAGGHGEQHARHHAVDVEERDRHQDDFLAFDEVGHPTLDLERVGQDVEVGGYRGLGNAGRPAAVLEQGRVVRSDVQFGTRRVGVLRQQVLEPDIALRQSALDAESAFLLLRQREQDAQDGGQGLFDVGDDQLFDFGLRLGGLDRFVEIGHHEHDLDPGIVDLIFDFGRRVKRIRRHHDPARLEDPEIGHHELRRVWHEDSHAVAFLHAHRDQRRRDAVGDGAHLFVRNDRTLKDRAGAVGRDTSGRCFQAIERAGFSDIRLWLAPLCRNS